MTPNCLEAVVGVDAEAEDCGDCDRLVGARGGLKFPAVEGGYDFGGHLGGAGLEDADVSQVAGSVEGAGDDHAGVG